MPTQKNEIKKLEKLSNNMLAASELHLFKGHEAGFIQERECAGQFSPGMSP